jgi:chromosome segregation ATPase
VCVCCAHPQKHVAILCVSQLQYNNDLLAQLRTAEEKQLVTQRESSEKQAALRQALTAVDMARHEANDAKREAVVAKEIASKLRDETAAARVEAERLKRTVDSLEAANAAMTNDVGNLKRQLANVADDAARFKQLASSLQQENEDMREKEGEHSGELRRILADTQRELALAKSRQEPLVTELEAAKRTITQLQNDVMAARQEHAGMKAAVTAANDRVRQCEDAVRVSAQKEQRLQHALSLESDVKAQLTKEIAQLKREKDGFQADVAALRGHVAEAESAVRALQGEVESSNKALTAMERDLLALAAAKSEDVRRFEAKLAAAREDADRLAGEHRQREAHLEEIITAFQTEISESKRDADAALATHQEQTDNLSKLVQKANQELSAQRKAHEMALDAAEQRFAQEKSRWQLELNSSSSEKGALLLEREQLLDDVTAARNALAAFQSRHVEIVSAMQAAVQQLLQDYHAVLDEQGKLSETVRSLQSQVAWASTECSRPLEAWRAGSHEALCALMQKVEDAENARENVLDLLTALQLQHEESKAQAIMLTEDVDKARHEASLATVRLRDVEIKTEEKQAKLLRDIKALEDLRTDQAGQIQRLKSSLDKCNAQLVALQSDNATLAQEHAESAAKYGAKLRELESQLSSADGELRMLRSTQEATQAERDRAVGIANDAGQKLRSANDQIQELEAALKAVSSGEKAKATHLQKQLATLTDGMNKMTVQLTNTQGLLSVVQQQRAALEEDNKKLQAEIDEVYRRQLGGSK